MFQVSLYGEMNLKQYEKKIEGASWPLLFYSFYGLRKSLNKISMAINAPSFLRLSRPSKAPKTKPASNLTTTRR